MRAIETPPPLWRKEESSMRSATVRVGTIWLVVTAGLVMGVGAAGAATPTPPQTNAGQTCVVWEDTSGGPTANGRRVQITNLGNVIAFATRNNLTGRREHIFTGNAIEGF